jgi:hypothetical protein
MKKNETLGSKLRMRREALVQLTSADLTRVAAGDKLYPSQICKA